jgi:hypothetical protein
MRLLWRLLDDPQTWILGCAIALSVAKIPPAVGQSSAWLRMQVSTGEWSNKFRSLSVAVALFPLLALLSLTGQLLSWGDIVTATTSPLSLTFFLSSTLLLVLFHGTAGRFRPAFCPLTDALLVKETLLPPEAVIERPFLSRRAAPDDVRVAPTGVYVPSPWRYAPIVFVTAHPDDESMFFSPVFTHLAATAEAQRSAQAAFAASPLSAPGPHGPAQHRSFLLYETHVLCLSPGGGGGDPVVRCRELQRAAALLGVNVDNVVRSKPLSFPDSQILSCFTPASPRASLTALFPV